MTLAWETRTRLDWPHIVAALLVIYLLTELVFPRLFSAFVAAYVVRPMLWAFLAWLVWQLPRYRPKLKLRFHQPLAVLALAVGLLQVFLLVVGGVVSGFGRSPYSFTPQGILINLVFVGTALVAMELSRAHIINGSSKRHTILALALVAVLFTGVSLPLGRFLGLGEPLATVTFLGGDVLPLLSENLLACFLAFLGGPLPALAYRGILQAFWWFCPILPDLTWSLKALLGTIAPIIGFVIVQTAYPLSSRPTRARRMADRGLVGWIIGSIVGVALIWFSLGLFDFYPTVVYSGSMRPTIDVGDVVIAVKVPASKVEEGDIIEFREGNITVIHRVIEVYQTKEARLLVTKGDANREPDSEPVFPGQVRGKVVLRVPKLGWASIAVKQLLFR